MGVKKTLDDQGLYARKRFGQHFLTDVRILESIVDAAQITRSDTGLEIGPGLGHLTKVLAARARQVTAVEIDRDLAARLMSELASWPNVRIVTGDVLDRQPIEWLYASGETSVEAGESAASISIPFKLVANLPYYITSAILRHVLEAAVKPQVIVVMVQREVAQRMVAQPPSMNLLAVSVQCFAQVKIMRTIAPGAFYPPPKVESAVVRMQVLDHPRLPAAESAGFFQVVHAGFGEKRKQLRNSLARGLGLEPVVVEALLVRASIDPSRRAETLGLEEWQALYREWVAAAIAKQPSRV